MASGSNKDRCIQVQDFSKIFCTLGRRDLPCANYSTTIKQRNYERYIANNRNNMLKYFHCLFRMSCLKTNLEKRIQ